MAGITPQLPLALGGNNGAYKLIKTYKNLIKQNFKNLILTAPGERMMDPHFGVGIRNFLFENDSPTLYSEISSAINSQVERYLPFVIIINISFVNAEQGILGQMPNNYLSMKIEYAIGPLDAVDNLSITVPSN